jgi:hypothetical protein
MMTDAEVVRYLGMAGRQVCGRFAPEQLGRDLALGTERRKKRWWHWLVAGLLVTAEARGQERTVGEVVKVEQRETGPEKGEKFAGKGMEQPRVQVLDTVKVVGYGVKKKMDLVLVVDVTSGPGEGVRQEGENCTAFLGAIAYSVRVYQVWRMMQDSLAAVGLAPKRELVVYPNPARRGSVVSLQWQRTEPGVYVVALFSSAGELLQQRKIQVGGKEQVDLLGLPPAQPAGMYFLRAARPGGAKVITLRIIVI